MIDLLPWAPLVPAALPLLLAALTLLGRSARMLGLLALVGLLCAAIPLLPIPGLPRQSPAWRWATIGGVAVPMQLSLAGARGAMSFLLLLAGALALWSVARLGWGRSGLPPGPGSLVDVVDHRAVFSGLLLVVGGGQAAVQSVAPPVAVLGVGIAALGSLLIDLLSAPADEHSRLPGVTPLLLALALLATASVADSSLASTADVWAAGCGLLILAGPARMSMSRVPLLLQGTAQAIGLSPLGAWLLMQGVGSNPLTFLGRYNGLVVAGSAVFVLGAINAVAGTSLRALLSAQWVAQLGLVLLAIGGAARSGTALSGAVVAALANGVVSTLVMSLTVGRLALLAGTERIADLPPLPSPLRRCGLAYALAAASAAGLPLTLGYALRGALGAGGGSPVIEAVLLAGSTLLLLGLAPPLAAFFRRPAWRSPLPADVDQGAGAGLLLGLLLVLAGPYRALGPVVDLFSAERSIPRLRLDDLSGRYLPSLATAALQIVGALLILSFASRALRHTTARPVFGGGVPLDEEPGWALPFAALAQLLTPLTPRPWLAAFLQARASSEGRLARARIVARRVEHRYYLGLIVLATVGVVLLAAGEVGR